ncbi:MAG TPA: GNAT family N-acetyltransferase [Gaiellaceae bacterium]|nr:GNAT family N-acetyltransferase [Gaiellaceae bacterium]
MTGDEIRALEEVGAAIWVAPEIAELDGWRLRSARGLTGRANSVLPNEPGRLPLNEKIDRVERWYAERGLPVRFQLTDASLPAGLDDALAARGYVVPQQPVCVETAPLPAVEADGRVALAAEPDDEWLGLWAGSRGFDDEATARALLTGGPGQAVFARIGSVAVGRAVAVGSWLGITSMVTVPSARRQGLGAAIVGALAAWGRSRRCERALLQVERDNHPARSLYARFGFGERYAYHYRVSA